MRPNPRSVESMVKQVALKLLLIFGGILASLPLLEVLLRFRNPFYARIKGNRIVLLANKRSHFNNNIIKEGLDPVITVTRNSLGFRGPEPPADYKDDLTIITVGGSTTRCFLLSDGRTWPDRLAKRLENSFRRIWVDNAGLDGHSSFGHVVLMEDYIRQLHPKVVIFLLGANDRAVSNLGEFEAENVKSGVSFESAKAFLKSLSVYSEVVALALNMHRSLTAYRAGLTHENIELTKVGYYKASAEQERQSIERGSNPSYLDGYARRLKRLIDIAKQAHIEPVFVTQPLLAGPAMDDVTKVDLAEVRVSPRSNGKILWYSLEAYNDVTRRVGRENGVLVIDLARQMPKSSRYFIDFLHVNNEGAQRVADVIYSSLCPRLASEFPQYVTRSCDLRSQN